MENRNTWFHIRALITLVIAVSFGALALTACSGGRSTTTLPTHAASPQPEPPEQPGSSASLPPVDNDTRATQSLTSGVSQTPDENGLIPSSGVGITPTLPATQAQSQGEVLPTPETPGVPPPENNGNNPQAATQPVITTVEPNLSLVTAEITESKPHRTEPTLTRIRVKVISSEPVGRLADLVAPHVGERAVFIITNEQMSSLKIGDTITAQVTYQPADGSDFRIVKLIEP